MKVIPTDIPGVLLIEPVVYRDARGFFVETYHQARYREAGLKEDFVQDNESRSVKGVLRGLHFQQNFPQGKLVRVVEGEVFDVAVDVRPDSPTFKKWVGFNLSADNFRQLYIPPGLAHGFYTLSDAAQVEYKCTRLYQPGDEYTLAWDDPEIGIRWPVAQPPLLSPKDAAGLRLADLKEKLPAQK